MLHLEKIGAKGKKSYVRVKLAVGDLITLQTVTEDGEVCQCLISIIRTIREVKHRLLFGRAKEAIYCIGVYKADDHRVSNLISFMAITHGLRAVRQARTGSIQSWTLESE